LMGSPPHLKRDVEAGKELKSRLAGWQTYPAKIVAIMPKSLRTRFKSGPTVRGETEGNARIINKICTLSLPVQD